MAKEIERKFLIHEQKINLYEYDSIEIIQGYLSKDYNPTIRIRISGSIAFLTVKGPNDGITRSEFEYHIPVTDAEEMLKLCHGQIISKTRFSVEGWEVDMFHRHNEGLIIAEIELDSVDAEFDKPDWIGEEVSDNKKYYNINLIG